MDNFFSSPHVVNRFHGFFIYFSADLPVELVGEVKAPKKRIRTQKVSVNLVLAVFPYILLFVERDSGKYSLRGSAD